MSGKTSEIGFAIIGCGLIGKKRAESLKGARLVAACDLDQKRADTLAGLAPNVIATTDVERAIHTSGVDAVVVATQNASLAPIARLALEAGKHVLVEKPGAVSISEINVLERISAEKKLCVRVGFNHRYHPAFIKAQEILKSGALGPLMFIRARYGHGGRVGYDREWRANPKLSGGGELMDQGVHLIDLAGLFLGTFTTIEGHAATYFWSMPVDDNAFMSLRNAQGNTAWLQVSCSEWKNLFSFELYAKNAKLHIEGLGGSYGVERLYHYQMLPEMGPPDTLIYEYPRGDKSWSVEMETFIQDIHLGRTPQPGLAEAKAALNVVEAIYKNSGFAR